MYPIDNIAERCLEKDRLSILILNDKYDKYVELLAKEVNHDFYLVNNLCSTPQWNKDDPPKYVNKVSDIKELGVRNFDAIICFDRTEVFERAINLSQNFHTPLITVDFASSIIKIPLPFMANTNIKDTNSLFHRNGDINIGITEYVSNSWQSHFSPLAFSIPLPYHIIENVSPDKILVDSSLPDTYIKSLPINFTTATFTDKPEEASIYLHLWQNVTVLMNSCMASNIPVVTMKSPDFTDIINSEACVIIDDLNIVGNSDFARQIQSFNKIESIKANAVKYIQKQNSQEKFKDQWEKTLKHASNIIYQRNQ